MKTIQTLLFIQFNSLSCSMAHNSVQYVQELFYAATYDTNLVKTSQSFSKKNKSKCAQLKIYHFFHSQK